jgi:hypothetical protein
MRRLDGWIERLLAAGAVLGCAVALAIAVTGGGQWRVGPVAISATDPIRPLVVACVLFALRLLARPPSGPPVRLVALILVPLAGVLLVQSTFRRVGDGAEYVAMAVNLAHGHRPSLTPSERGSVGVYFPGDDGFDLDMPALVGRDGRQDFPHFWLYSLLAAPFVSLSMALGATPLAGFLTLNVLLLGGALFLVLRRYGAVPTLFLGAGPILWWLDKAHTEVLTFAVLAASVSLLSSAPWWSLVIVGVGAAQNPPLAVAWVVIAVVAALTRGLGERRLWLGAATGAAIAAVHPLYYAIRLGTWSGLTEGFDRHWPSIRELSTVVIDPNVGIVVADFVLPLALVVALVLVLRRGVRTSPVADHVAVAAIGAALIVVFSQTTNFNSGGTPGPSRYGIWLLPLGLPLLGELPAVAWWGRALVAASLVWCTVVFAPRQPDHYLRPTWLAMHLWTSWPAADNPLAEIFAERLSGREPSPAPPVATPDCQKVLLEGPGGEPAWPPACAPVPAPDSCRDEGALCYANRHGGGYVFTPAPSGPAWRRLHRSSGAGG